MNVQEVVVNHRALLYTNTYMFFTFSGNFTAHRFAAKYGNDYIDEGARSSEVCMDGQ